jgi:hypothetical protein
LVWFEIMTNFQNETQNLAKSMHFQKIIYIQIWLWIKIWQIGATIYTINKRFQNISFENSFLVKRFFGAKGLQKGQ